MSRLIRMTAWSPVFALYLHLAVPLPVKAQAWVPPRGEGYVWLGYQSMFLRHHLLGSGQKDDQGHIRSNSVLIGAEYGITDRLALRASIPYVASKYSLPPGATKGRHFHDAQPIDDWSYHGFLQDFHFDLRYNALRDGVVLTPFFGMTVPSHRYPTFGHANPGRRLREYQVGVNVGRQLRPFLPRAYVDLRFSQAFVQRIADLNTDRSNADIEVGYFLRPSLILRGFGGWQKTYGGIERPFPEQYYYIHDRVWRAHYARAGGGVALSLTRSVDLYTGVITTLSGKNADAVTIIAGGVSWRFSTRRVPEEESVGAARGESPYSKPMREKPTAAVLMVSSEPPIQ